MRSEVKNEPEDLAASLQVHTKADQFTNGLSCCNCSKKYCKQPQGGDSKSECLCVNIFKQTKSCWLLLPLADKMSPSVH